MSEAGTGSTPTESFGITLERELAVMLRRARARSRMIAAAVGVSIEADSYVLLMHIGETENPRVTDVARYLGIGKPTVSRQIRILEEQGFIGRTPDPNDSRSSRLYLTDVGRDLFLQVQRGRQRVIDLVFVDWSEDEKATLARLLTKMNASHYASLETEDIPAPQSDPGFEVETVTSSGDRVPNS